MTKQIDLKNLNIRKAHDHLVRGDFSASELCQSYLSEISKKNKDINAYLEVFSDAEEQSKKVDVNSSLLAGIPIAIKDNILIKGKIASAASKILENYVATYDSTVTEKLKKEGVIFLGRCNMDEFAHGGSTENSAFGVTKNPYDLTRVSGGSSGGSAAAVAMDGALVSLGSDTGGSVRQPSSFCGVVGLKPTYGTVSRYGLIAMGSSLDQIGPIGKCVDDVEILFNAIKGKDALDSTSIFGDEYGNPAKKEKLVVGYPKELIEQEGIDKEVLKNFQENLKKFEDLGYEVKEVSLPNIKYSLAVYYIIMPAEVSSNLARFDGVKFGLLKEGDNLLQDYLKTRGVGFGKEARRRIFLGTYVLSAGYYDAYYNKAQALRNLIAQDFKKSFENVDIIVTPTSPIPAFKIGEKINDPLSMYLADIFTVTANIIGIPAISVPSGFTEKEGVKLPLGLQIMSAHCREDLLFKAGKDFLGE